MLDRVYRLVAPRTLEPVERQVQLADDSVVVHPTYLSICNADQRYYQGKRSAEVLARKLPMALIHEGIGTVCFDGTGTLARGTTVVMLPNNPVEQDPYIGENYLRSSQFCGSGYDGFMQEYVLLSPKRVVALPAGIDVHVAAFTELVSVAVQAVTRFGRIAHERRDTVGIWGDGNLGFIVALVLRATYPQMHLAVFGRNQFKLDDFTFVDETHLTYDISCAPQLDHAFECCGGDGSASAIDQIIDTIKPEGTVSLLGVSENPVAINTRMVLEKGLRLYGSSRSERSDFVRTLGLFERNPWMVDYLSALVGSVIPVASAKDVSTAFETDMRKQMGKTIMEWNV